MKTIIMVITRKTKKISLQDDNLLKVYIYFLKALKTYYLSPF